MIYINQVPVNCINQAAIQYHIPAALIVSILKIENGRTGSASPNKNGTYDYGAMQINTVWLKPLAKYGYTAHDLQYDSCLNVNAGTWILAQTLASDKLLWRGVGDYHSHSLIQNQNYRTKVNNIYHSIENTITIQNPISNLS